MVGRNILLTLVVGLAAAYAAWQYVPAEWTPIRLLGLGLALIGFVMWTVARFQLGNSLAVTAQAKQLVTRGIYSKIRNPIYVFASVFIVGFILILGRPKWMWIFALILPLQIWRVRKEASVLEAKFGEEYRKYRSATWF